MAFYQYLWERKGAEGRQGSQAGRRTPHLPGNLVVTDSKAVGKTGVFWCEWAGGSGILGDFSQKVLELN